MPAGNLRYRVGFYKRNTFGLDSPAAPDYGSDGGYPDTATFVVYANIIPKLGGEQVLAARLTGKNFVNIIVRKSTNTDQITTDWIAKNENSGEIYNIRSVIDPGGGDFKHGFFWEMLCEKGAAV